MLPVLGSRCALFRLNACSLCVFWCRDLNARAKGPTLLLGKRKKNLDAIKAHSAGFLPCMLGLQEEATTRNNSSHL